jgi:hypothetical protein
VAKLTGARFACGLQNETPYPLAADNLNSSSCYRRGGLFEIQSAGGGDRYAATENKFDPAERVITSQGEPFKSTKPSQKSGAGLTVSQCYFELPSTVNSVVLTVTQKAEGSGARDPKQSWQEIFHREKTSEKKGEEEEKEKEPQKIDGVGDEAFWTGTRVGGALYVLKGNTYIRISVGGAGDQAQKTEKSKALAESALKRL